MAPRRRTPVSTIVAGVGAATLLAGALTWAYYAFNEPTTSTSSSAPSQSTSKSSAAKSKAREGPQPSLTLVVSSFPPSSIIALLSTHFTLHLVIPSPSGSPLSPPPSYAALASSFDLARIIPHETAEGAIHVVRALAGTVVFANGDLPSESTETEQADDGQGSSSQGSMESLPLSRLIKDTRTFVRGVLVVKGDGGEPLGDESRGVAEVQGWEELVARLGV
ncbi:hypothetical protein BCR35DRAFT_303505 [Leucosporidium creatinivorum]|uniref:Uncharacterized protein n=1 Tax=Leucosporidium creatinivorum TaxID=106004 RepID=A0A1Y2FHL4_9BASI|nr:hypothetical protein BCR35DRAFT_303505 [Leucosporidium creatinivorum]